MAQMVKAGLQIQRFGKICYVGELRLFHGKLEIHSDDGDMSILSQDAFRREVVDGSIKMLVPDDQGILHPVDPGWCQNESKKAKAYRNYIGEILRYFEDCLSKGMLIKNIVIEIASFCQEKNFEKVPSERTLRYWRNKAKGHESRISPKWH